MGDYRLLVDLSARPERDVKRIQNTYLEYLDRNIPIPKTDVFAFHSEGKREFYFSVNVEMPETPQKFVGVTAGT
jgi:hypothetical protein